MQTLYVKICEMYHIIEDQILPLFIPKASEEEMRERRDRKLNPYKYLKQDEIVSDDEDVDIKPKKSKKPPLLRYKSENVKMKSCDAESDEEYEYEQKADKYEEDDFQGSISCSYWTPAHIRLPYKMVVKQVTLGGNHMVVLDDLGQVWSSGT